MGRKRSWLLCIAMLAGCGGTDGDDRYGVGYRDGYAVGFNTTCEIRATLVEGAWDDEDYSRGYAEGQVAGTIDCNASRSEE